jgi:hypothetical protein
MNWIDERPQVSIAKNRSPALFGAPKGQEKGNVREEGIHIQPEEPIHKNSLKLRGGKQLRVLSAPRFIRGRSSFQP